MLACEESNADAAAHETTHERNWPQSGFLKKLEDPAALRFSQKEACKGPTRVLIDELPLPGEIRDKVSSFVNRTSASFPPSLSLTLQVLQGQVSARIQLFLAVDDKEKEGFWAIPGCEKLQRLRRRQNKDVMGGGLDRWRAAASSSVSTSSNVNAGSAAAGVSSSLTPCVGDRIMVLKTRWLQCILNGAKTIELRGRQARLGRVWLGVGSEVHYGAATIARLMLTCRVQLRGLYGWQMC